MSGEIEFKTIVHLALGLVIEAYAVRKVEGQRVVKGEDAVFVVNHNRSSDIDDGYIIPHTVRENGRNVLSNTKKRSRALSRSRFKGQDLREIV